MNDNQTDTPSATIRSTVEVIVSRISRIESSEFSDDVLIREELGIDSLMAMEILAVCEKELRIEIDETEMYAVDTVGEFLKFLEDRYRSTHG
jgi:acyl carrier protein